MRTINKVLLTGALIGGSALGFAVTKPGKALRKRIAEAASDLYKYLETTVDNLKEYTQDQYEDLVETVVSAYASQKKLASDVVKALKKELLKKRTYAHSH